MHYLKYTSSQFKVETFVIHFCDFHSLQLFIKDLFELLSIIKVFQKVIKIVNTLKKAEYHLGILHSYKINFIDKNVYLLYLLFCI